MSDYLSKPLAEKVTDKINLGPDTEHARSCPARTCDGPCSCKPKPALSAEAKFIAAKDAQIARLQDIVINGHGYPRELELEIDFLKKQNAELTRGTEALLAQLEQERKK